MSSVRSVLAPSELAGLLRERPATRLLDVRTPAELETEHIAGAGQPVRRGAPLMSSC